MSVVFIFLFQSDHELMLRSHIECGTNVYKWVKIKKNSLFSFKPERLVLKLFHIFYYGVKTKTQSCRLCDIYKSFNDAFKTPL